MVWYKFIYERFFISSNYDYNQLRKCFFGEILLLFSILKIIERKKNQRTLVKSKKTPIPMKTERLTNSDERN